MFPEDALENLLRANAGLVAIAGTRMNAGPFMSQVTTFPVINFWLDDSEYLDKVLNPRAVGLMDLYRFEFFFLSTAKGATAYVTAKRLNEALRMCLSGYSGTVYSDSSPANTLDIQLITPPVSMRERYDDETGVYQILSRYDVTAPLPRPSL